MGYGVGYGAGYGAMSAPARTEAAAKIAPAATEAVDAEARTRGKDSSMRL